MFAFFLRRTRRTTSTLTTTPINTTVVVEAPAIRAPASDDFELSCCKSVFVLFESAMITMGLPSSSVAVVAVVVFGAGVEDLPFLSVTVVVVVVFGAGVMGLPPLSGAVVAVVAIVVVVVFGAVVVVAFGAAVMGLPFLFVVVVVVVATKKANQNKTFPTHVNDGTVACHHHR